MGAMAVAMSLGLVLLGGFLCRLLEDYILQRRSKKLPPGRMGWPYIGETLQLYSGKPNSFFASKQKRYGDVFKTHILGCPCVMIASPEAARFVLVTQAHLFKPTFPASKQRMIGPQALFFHEGPYHAKLRKLVVSSFTPESIRGMVSDIEDLVLATLDTWEGKKINTFAEMKKFAFKVGLMKIFGREASIDIADLNQAYLNLEKGYNSMPVNVPGTKFNTSMKARQHLSKMIEKVIQERRVRAKERPELPNLLQTLLDHEDETGRLSHEQVVDNIIGIIFASRDTTASVLTWLIKFLRSRSTLLESVTVSIFLTIYQTHPYRSFLSFTCLYQSQIK
ncbi:hypothetical protein KP509_21G027300 [Ceratopteris richardii]|uniref:Uncharacterized protein n=1 Tax=Ceratopteris richardii TaxID=49495 RepID=A0A8T2SA75_CERRI|nr:hypothetical protein KP509_21G027300 [Ceratopteris richardii]